jgi:tungstate transport system substrate-binding protein
MAAAAALQRIANGGYRFVSRSDEGGTHQRERFLWQKGGGRPVWDDYIQSGQGMVATLVMADQMQAYTLADRGTYLKSKAKIELVPLVTHTEDMQNPYGIMTVNPNKNKKIDHPLADRFVDFIISPRAQRMIQDFHVGEIPLFHPLHLPDRG